jgi:succinate dehydrogenase/fumarate reductase flavoprotein subunit
LILPFLGLSRDRAGLIQPLAAGMIARAALFRTEIRRAHQRSDFPAVDDLHSHCHICFRAGTKGEPVLETLPVEPS